VRTCITVIEDVYNSRRRARNFNRVYKKLFATTLPHLHRHGRREVRAAAARLDDPSIVPLCHLKTSTTYTTGENPCEDLSVGMPTLLDGDAPLRLTSRRRDRRHQR